jgi:hypothetical protein
MNCYFLNQRLATDEGMVRIKSITRGTHTTDLYKVKNETTGLEKWVSYSELDKMVVTTMAEVEPVERVYHVGEIIMFEDADNDGKMLLFRVEIKTKRHARPNKYAYKLTNMNTEIEGWFTGEKLTKLNAKSINLPIEVTPVEEVGKTITGMDIFNEIKKIDSELKCYEMEINSNNDYRLLIRALIRKEINHLNSKRENLLNQIDKLKVTI